MAHFVYFHNLDPFAIQITENLGIRWYGLAYIAGFLTGYFFLLYLSKKNLTPLTQQNISSLINYGIIGVLIGGRIGYCIFYQPELWVKLSSTFPYWGVLEIHKGGMASHGGIVGLFSACWLFSRKYSVSFLHLLDLSVLGVLGIFFGRLANFINGELYGRVVQGVSWLGVQFPREIYVWYSNWDVQNLLALKKVLPYIGNVKNPFKEGNLPLSLWESWVTSKRQFTAEIHSVLNQIIVSVESGNEQARSALSEVLPVRYPSQIYQAIGEGLIPFLIVCFLWLCKTPKQGWIAGMWGLSYLIMRFFGEQFREPDAHIGFDWLGLTRGQWLSLLALLCVGVYCFFVYKKHKNFFLSK